MDPLTAAVALAPLATAIVALVQQGLMSKACVDALCDATPGLREALPRLPLSRYLDARAASMVARGSDAADEILASRARGARVAVASLRAAARELGPSVSDGVERALRRAASET